MKKRLLSLLLVLAMVFSLMPAALAADKPSFQSFFESVPANAETEPGYPNSTNKWKVTQLGEEYVLMSGGKGKSRASSTLQLTFTADAELTFEYKVSSEAKYDCFTITYDGAEKVKESGDLGWKTYTLSAETGKVLTLTYKKDSSGDKFDDCVYVRNFTAGEATVVTFHANGGAGDDYTQNFYGQAALKPNAFTKADGVFAGWATTPDGEVAYTDGAKLNPTEAMDLYAVWTPAYTVTFAYNDGTTADTTVAIACGTAIGAAAIPQPTRMGYTFGGWFAGDAALTADTVIAANTTYTAAWTANTYTVQYLPNGGTGEMAAQTFTYDAEQALTQNAFTRAGYDFRGWNTSATGTAVQYTDGAAVRNLSADKDAVVKLYAVWAGQPVQVTLDRNDGSEPTVRTGVVGYNYNHIYDNGTARFNQIPDPTRTGYIFLGWFDAPEGGTEITDQTKFADTTPVTLYAHWEEGITVHFDGNGYKSTIADKTVHKDAVGKNLPYLSSYYYPADKALDGWYTAKEGGELVTKDTVFTESEITLYAHWRDYQYQVKFNVKYSDQSGVTGEMATVAVPFGVDYKLPACTFRREGYKFAGWSESSYGSTVKYADQATIHRDFEEDDWGDGSEDNEIYNLYAVWTKDVFGIAFDAVAAALPADGAIRTADALTLPTSGDGYTITYTSSAPAVLAADGTVTLPASGVQTVTLTATVTDTDGTVKTRDYTLTAYSAAAAAAEARLEKAAQALGNTFEPAYGKDTNAADAIAALLASKGYDDVTVAVKAAAGDAKASVDADGTIHYYFDAGMNSRGSYFYTTFVLSLDGASVEKEVYLHITWDLARAQAVLQAELDRITLPTEPVTSLTLPRYPVKEGIDPSQVDYSKYDNFNTWATLTWSSADDQIVKVGKAPSTPYYAPYATTLTRTAADRQVTLTASIVCNSVDGLTLTRTFTVTVAASQESQATLREQLQAKLDAGFASYGGLRDAVTGEPLEERDGKYIAANDIHFPTTRYFGVDGKYTPVIITSSDAGTIVPPDVNNAARVEVYRPLPGEDARDVTVTVTIKDKETGVAASRDFVITVQPLTQQEIDDELALMAEVKAHYFDGIRNGNTDPEHITGNLHAFREAYLNADGRLVWVYDIDDQANHGIVPSELSGWQDSEQWRLFRSTNPAVISHENLLVTRAAEHKAVTIVSELSSETLGKYAARYPDNADFQALSHQAVSVRLIVRGTAPTSDEPQVTTSTVTFQLHTDTDMWIRPTVVYDQPEGTTAMDVFQQVLKDNGYSYEAKGSYVQAVIKPDGTKVAELSKGPNSGWVFRVNGEFPDVTMRDYQLSDGDEIEVFFTANYMDEPGMFLPFTDVTNHWAYSAIKRMYTRGWMVGVDENTFAPDQQMSRAMLAVILYAMADKPAVTGENPFTDVPADCWYTDAVIWAAENGIVSGFGDGTFHPNDMVTRAQTAVMLYGYAAFTGADVTARADLSAYSDAGQIPSWAKDAMQWANARRLIVGRDSSHLAPNGETTRAEMAAILSAYIGK